MVSRVRLFFRAIASSILDMDDTTVPYEQLEILNDFLSRHQFDLKSHDLSKLMKELKKKHLVDSITVITKEGELVVSSEGNGHAEAQYANSLLSYIDNEHSTPESVLIKGSGNWFMVFPMNGKTYIIKSPASLSNIELKALAKEIEGFVEKAQVAKQAN